MEHLQLVFQWVPGQSWWGTWWEIPPSYTHLSLKHLSMTSTKSMDWMCVCSTYQWPAQHAGKKRVNSCQGERNRRHGRRSGVDKMRRRTAIYKRQAHVTYRHPPGEVRVRSSSSFKAPEPAGMHKEPQTVFAVPSLSLHTTLLPTYWHFVQCGEKGAVLKDL